jgi:hypothetical protein
VGDCASSNFFLPTALCCCLIWMWRNVLRWSLNLYMWVDRAKLVGLHSLMFHEFVQYLSFKFSKLQVKPTFVLGLVGFYLKFMDFSRLWKWLLLISLDVSSYQKELYKSYRRLNLKHVLEK